METHLTKLPYEHLSLPIQIFEPEIVLTAILAFMLIVFVLYENWKKMETEIIVPPTSPKKLSKHSERDIFRTKILAINPESAQFGDEVAELLREYIKSSLGISLSPTDTVTQMQQVLPDELGSLFVKIRNIRYAKKEHISETCAAIQSNIIELLDQHAI